MVYVLCIIFPSLNQHLMHHLSYTKSRCLINTLCISTLVGAIFRECHINYYLLNRSDGFKRLSDYVLQKCGVQE